MKSLSQGKRIAPLPAAKASDSGGERQGRTTNGIAMGKADATGSDKLFNTGRTAGTCYTHKKGC